MTRQHYSSPPRQHRRYTGALVFGRLAEAAPAWPSQLSRVPTKWSTGSTQAPLHPGKFGPGFETNKPLITYLLTGHHGLALTASRGTEAILVFSDFDGNMVLRVLLCRYSLVPEIKVVLYTGPELLFNLYI